MKKSIYISIVIAAFLPMILCACAKNDGSSAGAPDSPPQTGNEPVAQDVAPGEVVIAFDYEKQSGSASNQFAVWIEDMDGNYINTVCATKWTASGGHKSRPDSIAMWVGKSGIASMPDYYVDAIAGATPKTSGRQSYAWNLKDINGDTVSPGEYKFFVEGTLRWKNYVLYSGVITIGDAPATATAVAEYNYEASGNQPALTGESPENAMIGTVTASFAPAADR